MSKDNFCFSSLVNLRSTQQIISSFVKLFGWICYTVGYILPTFTTKGLCSLERKLVQFELLGTVGVYFVCQSKLPLWRFWTEKAVMLLLWWLPTAAKLKKRQDQRYVLWSRVKGGHGPPLESDWSWSRILWISEKFNRVLLITHHQSKSFSAELAKRHGPILVPQ